MATVINTRGGSQASRFGEAFGLGISSGIENELQKKNQREVLQLQNDLALQHYKDKIKVDQETQIQERADIMDAVQKLTTTPDPEALRIAEDNLISGAKDAFKVAFSPGQARSYAESVRKEGSDFLASRGLTTYEDPNTGATSAVPIRSASSLKLETLQAQSLENSIKARTWEQNYQKEKAGREGQEWKYRESAIEAIANKLQTDDRYKAVFGEWVGDNDARDGLAAKIYDNYSGFASLIVGVDRDPNVFVDQTKDILNLDPTTDIKGSKTKGYIPMDKWLRSQELKAKLTTKSGRAPTSREQINSNFRTAQGLKDNLGYAPGTINGAKVNQWAQADEGKDIDSMVATKLSVKQLEAMSWTPTDTMIQSIKNMATKDVRQLFSDLVSHPEPPQDWMIEPKQAVDEVVDIYLREMQTLGSMRGKNLEAGFKLIQERHDRGDFSVKAMQTIKPDSWTFTATTWRGDSTGKEPVKADAAFSIVDSLIQEEGLSPNDPLRDAYIDNLVTSMTGADREKYEQLTLGIRTRYIPNPPILATGTFQPKQ